MARLLRAHFASIGHRDARLAPLTLDFRDPTGAATDTVLWLRNGGGKSSIINLFFSVFRPNRNEFLGAAAEGKARRIEDYVKASDLAAVVTEWEVGDGAAGRVTRVVGRLLAWKGQIASSDPSKLRKLFFSMEPQAAGLDFETLPIQGLGEPVQTFDQAREWLRELAERCPAAHVVYTDNHRQWNEHLEKLGLDPELFRYQIRMNLREGAADEAFRFGSALEFVQFLLTLAFDTSHADQIARNLETLRDQFARRPELELEREFVSRSLSALTPLVGAVRAEREARDALDQALGDLGALRAGLGARAAEASAAARAAEELAAAALDEARRAGNERDKRSRWARGLEHRALELDVAEARARAAELAERVQAWERTERMIRAAQQQQALGRLEAEIASLTAELRRAEARLEPERQRLEAAGGALRRALSGEATRLDQLLADLDARIEVARNTDERRCQRVEALVAERARLEQRIAALRAQLARRDRARDKLQREGWLEAREPVATALDRWARAAEEADARLDDLDRRTTESQARLAALAERERDLHEQRLEQERARGRAADRLDQGLRWRQRLASEALVIELEAVDEPDPAAPGLEERLRGEARAAARDILQINVDGAEDERSLAAIDSVGLLPPSRDVERVTDALRARGWNAHPGVGYVAETTAAADRLELIRRHPACFGGVVLATDALPAELAGVVADLVVRGPVQVTAVGAGLGAASESPAAHVIPPCAAAYDHGSAQELRAELDQVRRARQRRVDELEARRAGFERIAGDLARFLEAFGHGKLAELEEARAAADAHLRVIADELEGLDRERGELGERLTAFAEERAAAARELDRAERAALLLRQLWDEHESEVEAVRAGIDEAEARARQATRELDEGRIAQRESAGWHEQLREERRDQGRARDEVEREAANIVFAAEQPDAAPPIPLDQARDGYRLLLERWQALTSDSKLQWQLEQKSQDAATARARLTELARGLPAAELHELSLEPDLHERLRDAEHRRAGARDELSDARAVLRRAEAELADARGRRDARDLPPGEPPATASAARVAAALQRDAVQAHADQARAAEERAAAAQDEVHRRARQGERLAAAAHTVVALAEGAGLHLPEAAPAPVPDDPAELAALIAARRERFVTAQQRLGATTAAVQRCADQVRSVVNQRRFADLRSQARERLSAEAAELCAECERLAAQLAPRLTVLDEQLGELDTHRRILVEALERVGVEAGRLLMRATRASVLPAQLGAWAGKPYLRIGFQFPGTDDERRARLEPLVDRLVQQAQLPGGLELVKLAVAELAGGKGFDVKILKPDAVLRPDPLPITAMTTFSRGQQLTAAILLYCTLVQLRARSRGRGPAAVDAGILVLDNPIGTCSSVPLLELQRSIARIMRVQLIYATGVDDLEALETLPNKIRLRNMMRDRATGDLHVTRDGHLEAVRIAAVGAG